jgi:hypothetical protein
MSQKQNQLSRKEWKSLSLQTRIRIVWIIFSDATLKQIEYQLLKWSKRVDLWLFPPVGFWASYGAISKIIPAEHPMAFYAKMATSFMFATLTLFLLRPKNKNNIRSLW